MFKILLNHGGGGWGKRSDRRSGIEGSHTRAARQWIRIETAYLESAHPMLVEERSIDEGGASTY